jgi:hypothetical protein
LQDQFDTFSSPNYLPDFISFPLPHPLWASHTVGPRTYKRDRPQGLHCSSPCLEIPLLYVCTTPSLSSGLCQNVTCYQRELPLPPHTKLHPPWPLTSPALSILLILSFTVLSHCLT